MDFKFYGEIVIKLVITVLLLLFYIKISGKSQLAPMNAFDQIGNMIVGAISGTTLLNHEVKPIDSTVFMLAWIAVLLFIRFLRAKSINFKELIDGKRIPLVQDGKLLIENFEKSKISVSNMEIFLHKDGLNGLHEAENIWLEPNGQFTIDKKGDKKMSIILIENGMIHEENLKSIGYNREWLLSEVKKNTKKEVEDIFYAEWVEEKLWIYPQD